MGHIQPDTHLPKDPKVKVYTALLTQTGETAPTVTVLQNTTGQTVTWTRTAPGQYDANTTNAWTTAKTTCQIQNNLLTNKNAIVRFTAQIVRVYTYNLAGDTGADGLLANTTVTIKIYE